MAAKVTRFGDWLTSPRMQIVTDDAGSVALLRGHGEDGATVGQGGEQFARHHDPLGPPPLRDHLEVAGGHHRGQLLQRAEAHHPGAAPLQGPGLEAVTHEDDLGAVVEQLIIDALKRKPAKGR